MLPADLSEYECYFQRLDLMFSKGARESVAEIVLEIHPREDHPSYDDAIRGEFMMRWYRLGGDVYPHLEMFDDSWAMFKLMPEFFARLAKLDRQRISPEQFCEFLRNLSFEDRTDYTRERARTAKQAEIARLEAEAARLRQELND